MQINLTENYIHMKSKQYELIIDVIENDASKFILNYVPQNKITPKLYIYARDQKLH